MPPCTLVSSSASQAPSRSALLGGCGGGGGGVASATPERPSSLVLAVEYGRLVDIYGLQVTPQGASITLYRKDVVVGGNIQDERPTNSALSDNEILYDFIGTDPDTLQARLFIPRDVTGPEVADAYDALDDELRVVSPMLFGQNGRIRSRLSARAGIRLRFSAPLGIDDSFFVGRDSGQVTELRNTEAVRAAHRRRPRAAQRLRADAGPHRRRRVGPRPRRSCLGPRVCNTKRPTTLRACRLLRTSSARTSASRSRWRARSPAGLRSQVSGGLTGLNNSQRDSIVRDFRSGNQDDDSADIARGFVRDPLPLRVIGEIPMYLEASSISKFTQEITVYKNGLSHEIDRGDVIRFVNDSSGVPFGSAEVVVDPEDDRDNLRCSTSASASAASPIWSRSTRATCPVTHPRSRSASRGSSKTRLARS